MIILSKKVLTLLATRNARDPNVYYYTIDQEMIQGEMYKYNSDMYSISSDVFRSVLDRYAPLKG